MKKKYYVLRSNVYKALINEEEIYENHEDISDATWKKISIIYTEEDFIGAFNGNEVDAGGDYLRIL